MRFQSTPPVWGATSIIPHACNIYDVSIHAPRVGGDVIKSNVADPATQFQSTPPVWGATQPAQAITAILHRFNPRPPCGGRRLEPAEQGHLRPFQSTPPVWGATGRPLAPSGPHETFQSTPPVWGATELPTLWTTNLTVSIHAPRVGGDATCSTALLPYSGFNPRPPCGGRRRCTHCLTGHFWFQSTPPVWGATDSVSSVCGCDLVSIHAPRVGGDNRSVRTHPTA